MVYINTSNISNELRPYLLLYLELITESPIRRTKDGIFIPYEEVVAALESDTVSLETTLGLESTKQFSCGSYSQTALLMMKVDYRKYNRGIQWVVDLLNHTEFTIERIRVCGAKIANAVSQAKRNGNAVTYDLLKAIFYSPKTNVRTCSMIHQHRFLTSLLEQLHNDKQAEKIVNDLNKIREEILTPNRLSLYIAGDWKKILAVNSDELYSNFSKIINTAEPFE